MSSARPSDLELIILNYVRNQYENEHKQNVPMALKYLMIQFSNRIIGCKLLTIKQDLDFYGLLLTKLPSVRRFNFLFRASDHNYSAKKFHKYCGDKGETIVIIKSNWGNIFGGYTSESWKASEFGEYRTDKNAFLFLIKSEDDSIRNKCPLLLELNKDYDQHAIRCDNYFGPVFGKGHDICIVDDCNKIFEKKLDTLQENYCCQWSYDYPKVNICGGYVLKSNNSI